MKNLNELAKEIHAINVKNGFFEDEKNIGEMLMLTVSEISEALEADRKGRYYANCNKEQSWFISQGSVDNSDFKIVFESLVKDTFEDELADVIIRVLDLAKFKGIDIQSHVEAKMRYNSLRPYKHGKKY